jgi:hypothetical protein
MNFFFPAFEFAMPLSHWDSVRRFKILPVDLKNRPAQDSQQVRVLCGSEK